MILRYLVPFLLLFLASPCLNAQTNAGDSLQVAKTLKALLAICRSVDFADLKTAELGTFYKAAPYIVFRGDDQKRKWKDFANYKNAEEKKGVDEVCFRINANVNQDSSYKIIRYFTEKDRALLFSARLQKVVSNLEIITLVF